MMSEKKAQRKKRDIKENRFEKRESTSVSRPDVNYVFTARLSFTFIESLLHCFPDEDTFCHRDMSDAKTLLLSVEYISKEVLQTRSWNESKK
jgi:hypothetical protein